MSLEQFDTAMKNYFNGVHGLDSFVKKVVHGPNVSPEVGSFLSLYLKSESEVLCPASLYLLYCKFFDEDV